MSTTDGAFDQKLFYDLEWIYHCLLPKTDMQMKHASEISASIEILLILFVPHFVTNLNL